MPATHPPIMRFFDFDHLPPGPLRDVSAMCARLAWQIGSNVPDGAEKTAGLRKLLEAKDCFVRASLPEEQPKPVDPV